jgi:hypothetical protein
MEGNAERWPRLIAEHRERQLALASAQPRGLRRDVRQTLWVFAAISGVVTAWMAMSGIRWIDLSPADGLADSVGLAWAALYAGALLALLLVTDGIVVGLGRSMPPVRRAVVWSAAAALTALVAVVLVLLQVSAQRLTYV